LRKKAFADQDYKNVEKEATFFLGRSLRSQDIEVFAASVDFVSDFAPAVSASVFILVAFG
jgi:hypothetical protein